MPHCVRKVERAGAALNRLLIHLWYPSQDTEKCRGNRWKLLTRESQPMVNTVIPHMLPRLAQCPCQGHPGLCAVALGDPKRVYSPM